MNSCQSLTSFPFSIDILLQWNIYFVSGLTFCVLYFYNGFSQEVPLLFLINFSITILQTFRIFFSDSVSARLVASYQYRVVFILIRLFSNFTVILTWKNEKHMTTTEAGKNIFKQMKRQSIDANVLCCNITFPIVVVVVVTQRLLDASQVKHKYIQPSS